MKYFQINLVENKMLEFLIRSEIVTCKKLTNPYFENALFMSHVAGILRNKCCGKKIV